MNDPVFQNIRVYWLAFVVYWGIVLFGYDTGVAGGVVNNAYFQKHFGLLNPDGSMNTEKVNAVSSNVVSVLQAGAFFGALGSAVVSPRLGRRLTLWVFSLLLTVGAVLTSVAESPSNGLVLIYLGRVISGLGLGGVSAVAPAFVSESSPREVRGRITGLFQIMVAIGVMLSYFINYGIGIRLKESVNIWRIPFAFQLVPTGIMMFGLLTIKESPRWLSYAGRRHDALRTLAYLRRCSIDDIRIFHELAEIEAAVEEDQGWREGLYWKEAFLGEGNLIRFVIAAVIFLLQQWSGQNSVNYYAPQIFASIGFRGTKNSLLAAGIYGVVKVVATSIFVFFSVERLGRKLSLTISACGMGTLLFIIGAILKTHPTKETKSTDITTEITSTSRTMAGMLYIYVCFYSMGWGPLPWVYVADIFPTRTRHYGLAVASASQWLWNFVVSKVTPDLFSRLGWKTFILFGTVNIGGMGVFSILIPETKGRSLEDMDIIFGAITQERRTENIDRQQKSLADARSSFQYHFH